MGAAELSIGSVTRARARETAQICSSVGRVVAGIMLQSARTREDVRSAQQDCAVEMMRTANILVGMPLASRGSMALSLSTCGVYRLQRRRFDEPRTDRSGKDFCT